MCGSQNHTHQPNLWALLPHAAPSYPHRPCFAAFWRMRYIATPLTIVITVMSCQSSFQRYVVHVRLISDGNFTAPSRCTEMAHLAFPSRAPSWPRGASSRCVGPATTVTNACACSKDHVDESLGLTCILAGRKVTLHAIFTSPQRRRRDGRSAVVTMSNRISMLRAWSQPAQLTSREISAAIAVDPTP